MAAEKKLKTIVLEIRRFCESKADEKQAQRYARFFTEGYDAYGISSELFLEQKDTLELLAKCLEE
ncbi:MAG: hypothetical protein JXR73_19590 [Candidatus Omnitrophica bacterium]|nr:hypothetical protein [Candidatus Omnitrophota bacterium]